MLQGAKLEESDFIEACDRILLQDEWFPTIARIIEVVDICARERRMRASASRPVLRNAPIVCGMCHGARFMRQGGYSPSTRPDIMPVGGDGTRTLACPHCTANGKYDADKEAKFIRVYGGVPDPNAGYMPDMDAVTWPAQLDALRGDDGRIDGDKLYRLSRELRGLDPDVDERVAAVAGWKSAGSVRAMTPRKPATIGDAA